ncbi:unnamed protein product [Lota lota]
MMRLRFRASAGRAGSLEMCKCLNGRGRQLKARGRCLLVIRAEECPEHPLPEQRWGYKEFPSNNQGKGHCRGHQETPASDEKPMWQMASFPPRYWPSTTKDGRLLDLGAEGRHPENRIACTDNAGLMLDCLNRKGNCSDPNVSSPVNLPGLYDPMY